MQLAPAQGPAGGAGAPGQDGSPDTAAQVLTKLLTVDGAASGVDADAIDNTTLLDLVARHVGGSSTVPNSGVRFISYFMDTDATNTLDVGQVSLKTNSTPGQFQVCDDTLATGQFQFVVTVNGTRTAGLLPENGCSAVFDAGVGGDFEVASRRSQIFGVGEGLATSEDYQVFGFTSL